MKVELARNDIWRLVIACNVMSHDIPPEDCVEYKRIHDELKLQLKQQNEPGEPA